LVPGGRGLNERGDAFVTNKVKIRRGLYAHYTEAIQMLTFPALLKALPLAALLASVSLTLAIDSAEAQQERRTQQSGQGIFKKPQRGPLIGGTSWTLSDTWGEPEMPEPSLEYPGYNYPPGGYTLNGPPNQSPYPN